MAPKLLGSVKLGLAGLLAVPVLVSTTFAQDTTVVRDTTPVQDTTTVGDTTAARDSLLLDHSFTAPGEFVRVQLRKTDVYRAELSSPEVSLDIHQRPSGPPAFLSRTEAGPGASGRVAFEVYTRADGEYEIRVLGLGEAVVNVKLYYDAKASARREEIIDKPGWEIGVEIGAGAHTGYLLNLEPGVQPDNDKGSWDVEGCFSARNGPGIARVVSGCALGIGWHERPESAGVLWFFIEPRIRILGGRERGKSNTEVGVLFRAALGEVSKVNRSPIMLAPGAYLSRHIRTNPSGKGWSFTLGYAHMFISNLGAKYGTFPTTEDFGQQQADRLTFSIGYYQ
ncbi:MAG TPA: hypothetical protein VL853_08510 [Gemmatimonadales bacterium]|nr:hypothetical protein [Gemmatimonadales bacterium]